LRNQPGAFSLVELVIVIVIVGIIAAIAVPRFSSASHSAQAKSVAGTLKIVNNAMELYKADHGYYPGMKPDGTMHPNGMFANELLAPLDGNPGYLRGASFPTNPFNNFNTAKRDVVDPGADPGAFGWFANISSGSFNINMWKSAVPADYDLCDLIQDASPAPISYNHPGAAACGGG
jgi:prepilin-type N-terminal cleavage/methylation domain-containing protein